MMLPPGKTEVKLSGRFSEAEVTALADELFGGGDDSGDVDMGFDLFDKQ